MKTIVLGLGNLLRSDGGVGVYASRRVGELMQPQEAEIAESPVAGFALLGLLEGYDRAVIIDAARSEHASPGDITVHEIADGKAPAREIKWTKPTLDLVAAHQIDLPTAIRLAAEMGTDFPSEVFVVGVEIEDDRTLCSECTPAVTEAIEPAANTAIGLARDGKAPATT